MLSFYPYFYIRHSQEDRVIGCSAGPTLPSYSFLLRGRMGLRTTESRDRKNRSLENYRRPYRESNPELPVLWHSASTNCTIRLELNYLITRGNFCVLDVKSLQTHYHQIQEYVIFKVMYSQLPFVIYRATPNYNNV